MRPDDAALVEQRQPAGNLENALDHEHHVGTARIIFIEAQSDVVLQRPGQHAVAEFGDLLAVLQHDRVLADEIDAGNVAVEIDSHQRPVEARGDLLDMRRFARAVIARHHHAAVEGEARENGEGSVLVEEVVGVEIRHVLIRHGIGGRLHIRVDAEHLAHRHGCVRRPGDGRRRFGRRRRRLEIHKSSTPAAAAPGKQLSIDIIDILSGRERPATFSADRAVRPVCWP